MERPVDIRRFPGSRSNAAAARGEIPSLASGLGIDYRWDERLGGRRRRTTEERDASPDTWWRAEAFRAYAEWTRSPEFRAAVDDLLADDHDSTTAILCSEAVWWRCHRRVVADVLALEHGTGVRHLLHDGRLVPHEPSPGVRLDSAGRLVWDGDRPDRTALPSTVSVIGLRWPEPRPSRLPRGPAMSVFFPYIAFPGNAAEAFPYYQELFGGELNLMTYDGMPGMEMDGFTPPPGAVAHATLVSDSVTFAGGDGFGENLPPLRNDVYSFLLGFDTVDEGREFIEKVVAGGGAVAIPFEPAPWGDTYGQVHDRFGLRWDVNVEGQRG